MWRFAMIWLAAAGLSLASPGARAQDIRVMETGPADHAVVAELSAGLFVRFDRPVDHLHSVLMVKRGEQVVATLQPRLKASPEVLFARAPVLPAGQYKLYWLVRTFGGIELDEGEISFTLAPKS